MINIILYQIFVLDIQAGIRNAKMQLLTESVSVAALHDCELIHHGKGNAKYMYLSKNVRESPIHSSKYL
jgi:hypothetical protein